ncbi:MAG: sensor histidine kinase [Candidatus Aquicultor sp.]
MFHSARLKLTVWYLLSIMVISVLFSLAVFQGATFEINRGLRAQAMRDAVEQGPPQDMFHHPFGRNPGSSVLVLRGLAPGGALDNQLYEEARRRVALQLLSFNGAMFVIAGMAGYFLAGRTLRPIENMVDEQKRFVADASHELRTPLTAMRTEVEVALRDKDFDTPYAREVLASNLEEIEKLQQLSDSLLILGRYQNTGSKSSFKDVSVLNVVEAARQNVKALANNKHIEIEGTIDDVTAEADGDSLVKLLTILLDNAIKYSNQDGKIIVRAYPVKNKVAIIVQDFGTGIRASDLPYIFKRFYRAEASRTKTKVEGYGLGLSIAKTIVDMHNGTIDVESVPDKGTTFTITLPRKQ